jgi:hypothetical protein
VKKRSEAAWVAKEVQDAMQAKTNELEAELRALRAKQESLESEVAGLKDTVNRVSNEARLARDELHRANSMMTSKYFF